MRIIRFNSILGMVLLIMAVMQNVSAVETVNLNEDQTVANCEQTQSTGNNDALNSDNCGTDARNENGTAAACSRVEGTIVNTAAGKGCRNIATGDGAKADLDTVRLENSELTGKIANHGETDHATNIAAGRDATAGLCAVKVKNGVCSGTVSNWVEADNVNNIAMGTGSEANYGCVLMKSGTQSNNPATVINAVCVSGTDGKEAVSNIAVNGKTKNKNCIVLK